MKKNLILALKNRVIRLSHPQHRNESLQKLKKLLIDNSYPIKFINSLLFNYNERSSFMLQQNNTNDVRIDSNAVSNNTLPSLIHYFLTIMKDQVLCYNKTILMMSG
nr:unnamed protein product [Callosobruchus analis]